MVTYSIEVKKSYSVLHSRYFFFARKVTKFLGIFIIDKSLLDDTVSFDEEETVNRAMEIVFYKKEIKS